MRWPALVTMLACLVAPILAADDVAPAKGAPTDGPRPAPGAAAPADAAQPGDADPSVPPDKQGDTPPPPKKTSRVPSEFRPESLQGAPAGQIVHFRTPVSDRPFSFFVPEDYDAGKAYPLLVSCTGRGFGHENITRFWPLARKLGFIAASSDTWACGGKPSERAPVAQKLDAWSRETGEIQVPQLVRDIEDIRRDLKDDAVAIRDMVKLLQQTYNIDARLIVLTGYSGGGWVAYYVGLQDPERYAGICIRSGSFHSGLLPPNVARARKMPVQVVIGDRDLDLVLRDTDTAERYFTRMGFENFQVERLPHSGHDNRSEVAANFIDYLRRQREAEKRAEVTARRDKYLKAAKVSLEAGETEKARQWLRKAAEVENEAGLPDKEAGEMLRQLEAKSESKESKESRQSEEGKTSEKTKPAT